MTMIDASAAPSPGAVPPHDDEPIRVLVVDDDAALSELVSMTLRYENWLVETAMDGAEAVAVADRFEPDLVVLDMMLPDMSGLEVLRELRRDHPALPVVFVTAKDSVEDRAAGLAAGGDDYLVKPFTLTGLVHHIREALRRTGFDMHSSGSELVVGDLVLDVSRREVSRGGAPISLTATEFDLLHFLMQHPQHLLTEKQILDAVWHNDFGGAKVVRLYIGYLRDKVDRGREPIIAEVPGAGYVLRATR